MRLAYVDDVDGSAAVLPRLPAGGYTPDEAVAPRRQLHGYNPANPDYVRWWSVDDRHHADPPRGPRRTVVYIEPHGRGNTAYRGFGENDVLRAIAEAKKAFQRSTRTAST